VVSVDGVVVNNHISDGVEAAAIMFGLYYIMNIEYPPVAAVTSEFLQR
jgi:hypothetical protein